MATNEYMLDMKCHECGASIALDIENLIGFCPHCGTKLLVDPIAFKEILIEKEKTKRMGIKYTHEKEMFDATENRKAKLFKLKVALGIVGAGCILIAYGGMDLIGMASLGFMLVGFISFFALLVMSENNK